MSFTKPRYDADSAKADLKQSVMPMQYNMYLGAHVNGNVCNATPPAKHYSQIDVESDMKGLNRFHPRTVEKMTSPDSTASQIGSNSLISTFDPRAHVNVNPAVCPDVTRHLFFNSGIQRPNTPGYAMPSAKVSCSGK